MRQDKVFSWKHHINIGRGNITFDNFVQVCATIRSLTMAFQRFDTDGDGVIQIAYEQVCKGVVLWKKSAIDQIFYSSSSAWSSNNVSSFHLILYISLDMNIPSHFCRSLLFNFDGWIMVALLPGCYATANYHGYS